MTPIPPQDSVFWLRAPTARPVVEAHLEHVAGTFRAAGWRLHRGVTPPGDFQGALAVLDDPLAQPLPAVADFLARAQTDAGCWRLPRSNGSPGRQNWPLRHGPYTARDYSRLAISRRGGERATSLEDPWCGFAVAAAGEGSELLSQSWPPPSSGVRLVPRAHLFRYDDPAGHRREELDRFIPDSARTLVDIGCGHGFFGARHRQPGRKVIGIEPDKFLARQAADRLDLVLPMTAEAGLAALKDDLDCVVFADVLEHTTDAAAVLRATSDATSTDGRVIVSVPNAAWAPVLQALAAGRWDATLAGTQARDHFTPFSRASFVDLAAECGLETLQTEAVEVPLPWRLRCWTWLAAKSSGGQPADLLASQWIFVLRPRR